MCWVAAWGVFCFSYRPIFTTRRRAGNGYWANSIIDGATSWNSGIRAGGTRQYTRLSGRPAPSSVPAADPASRHIDQDSRCHYIRFHGVKRWYRHDYTIEELGVWARRIDE